MSDMEENDQKKKLKLRGVSAEGLSQSFSSAQGYGAQEYGAGEYGKVYSDVNEETPRGPHTNNAQLNLSGLSDTPSVRDEIGFTPYVEAVAWFLSSDNTKPPLTISIEGPWGSGKSSFMMQLSSKLRDISYNRKSKKYGILNKLKGVYLDFFHSTVDRRRKAEFFCIHFNAWKSDKDEALWASFALSFIKDLEKSIPWYKRIFYNLKLLFNRLDILQGETQIIQLFFAILLMFLIYFAPSLSTKIRVIIEESDILKYLIYWLPFSGSIWWAWEKSSTLIFSTPLSMDLKQYVANPKYEDKISVIERFQTDFNYILKSYTSGGGRIFVFIDDLDRCEVPRAADLMQAINLLLSTDHENLFFILGIDREMVAAGLAAKYEKILPYLTASRDIERSIQLTGIEFGYSFLEKFIQVPFRVPSCDKMRLEDWIPRILNIPREQIKNESLKPTNANVEFKIFLGKDPAGIEDVALQIAIKFKYNPRQLKQFINLLRLRVMIAVTTNVLAPSIPTEDKSSEITGITLEQLGLFTAISIRWPRLISHLMTDPQLINKIIDDNTTEWDAEASLKTLLKEEDRYSLREVDLTPLLMILPNTYSGDLNEANFYLQRSTLVPAGNPEMSIMRTTGPSSNTYNQGFTRTAVRTLFSRPNRSSP